MSKALMFLLLMLLIGGVYLFYNFGFKDKNLSSINGAYEYSVKNEYGDKKYIATLNIFSKDNKSFIFGIDVNTVNGYGELRGKGEIVDTENVTAKAISGENVCELSFQIDSVSIPQSVSVKETSSECTYFHRESAQFEHTYTKIK